MFQTGFGRQTGFQTGFGRQTGFQIGFVQQTGFQTGSGPRTEFETGFDRHSNPPEEFDLQYFEVVDHSVAGKVNFDQAELSLPIRQIHHHLRCKSERTVRTENSVLGRQTFFTSNSPMRIRTMN